MGSRRPPATGRRTGRPRLGVLGTALASAIALGVLPSCTSTASTPPDSTSGTVSRSEALVHLGPEQSVTVGAHHFSAQCGGSGPSVIMLIGYGGSMSDWADLPDRLAVSARTCTYDRLGVGRSDSPPERQTFESIAGDLDGVITALHLQRPVVVVGHGLGAPIAVTWASKHPADVRALVLLDPEPRQLQGRLLTLLPPPDLGDPDLTSLLRDIQRFNDPLTNAESLDPRSWRGYDLVSRVGAPLWVVLPDARPTLPDAVDAEKLDAAWVAGQRSLLDLTDDGRVVSVPGSELMWRSHPEIVVSAVAQAVKR